MRNERNFTLLHWAAYHNSTSCVSVLLRFAPHLLDAVNEFNNTPLMCAVRSDRRDAAKILLRAGADVRTEDENGYTVFDLARDRNHEGDVGNIGTTSTGKWNILILLKL